MQADALSTGPGYRNRHRIGPKARRLSSNPSLETCTPPPLRFRSAAFSHLADPLHRTTRMREMKLQDLKAKTPAELVSFAEELEVENASTMRKQELMFGI